MTEPWPGVTLQRVVGESEPWVSSPDVMRETESERYIPESRLLGDEALERVEVVLRYDDSAQTIPELAAALIQAVIKDP